MSCVQLLAMMTSLPRLTQVRLERIDVEHRRLVVRRARQRPRWRHGCDGTCGRKVGGNCPKRVSVRTDTADTKSRAGRRTIGLPDELVALLHKHRDEQVADREHAAQLWIEGDWVFASPTGSPLNPNTDYDEWKRLLKMAGLRDGRLHDARHTAATVLLVRCAGTGGDGHHGLVVVLDGEALPASHRANPQGHRQACRRAAGTPSRRSPETTRTGRRECRHPHDQGQLRPELRPQG